ncbi:hypothetical protein M7I_1460 [Glarea lozoyensis 74030]|uniref:Uncharacterized protein n=1 Tax=Glarea lozoyensis (strain ATCC 74030 / MF5533) TaxID=1104152 RepID=H0EG52_GLAL7|nr:hypothetical protein M7I_1460 [Glarea lozoyensis 74030]
MLQKQELSHYSRGFRAFFALNFASGIWDTSLLQGTNIVSFQQ